jgi:hypothetical protein
MMMTGPIKKMLMIYYNEKSYNFIKKLNFFNIIINYILDIKIYQIIKLKTFVLIYISEYILLYNKTLYLSIFFN